MAWKAGQWAFGHHLEGSSDDGFPVILWADSVLPYSKPPDAGELPWWTPPTPELDRGQYQWWQRNFSANGNTGAPNFPEDRPYNAVMVGLGALKVSETAPFLFGTGGNDDVWPHTLDNGAIDLCRYYIANYLGDGTDGTKATYFIPQIPVREIMNYVDQDGRTTGDPPVPTLADPTDGENAIIAFVEAMLDPALGAGDRLLAWNLFDEPDGEGKNDWSTPEKLQQVAHLVRTTEYNWRITNEEWFQEAAGIPEDQKRVWRRSKLRPLIVTFTDRWLKPMQGAWRPSLYRDALAGEVGDRIVYMIDHYSLRRTRAEVELDYTGRCLTNHKPFDEFDIDSDDIAKCIERFRALRSEINQGPRKGPFKEPWIPIGNWIPADGSPFKPFCDELGAPTCESIASPDTEPAPRPLTDSGDCQKHPSLRQLKKMPEDEQVRYLVWGSLFEGSEGMFNFFQPGMRDNWIIDRFNPVAHEVEYFYPLRILHDHLEIIEGGVEPPMGNWEPPESGPGKLPPTELRPIYFLVNFWSPPSVTPPGAVEVWFLICNHRRRSTIPAIFRFPTLLADQELVEYRGYKNTPHFRATGVKHVLNSQLEAPTLVVPPYSFKMFKVV